MFQNLHCLNLCGWHWSSTMTTTLSGIPIHLTSRAVTCSLTKPLILPATFSMKRIAALTPEMINCFCIKDQAGLWRVVRKLCRRSARWNCIGAPPITTSLISAYAANRCALIQDELSSIMVVSWPVSIFYQQRHEPNREHVFHAPSSLIGRCLVQPQIIDRPRSLFICME